MIETLRSTEFYRPAHEIVFDAITDVYARGEMARIGGAPYVHTLVASVPLAANAGYYAHIVREKAILRRLVEAGTKIVQLGYAGEGEVDDVVDEAQAEVYSVTEKWTAEDYAPLKDIMRAPSTRPLPTYSANRRRWRRGDRQALAEVAQRQPQVGSQLRAVVQHELDPSQNVLGVESSAGFLLPGFSRAHGRFVLPVSLWSFTYTASPIRTTGGSPAGMETSVPAPVRRTLAVKVAWSPALRNHEGLHAEAALRPERIQHPWDEGLLREPGGRDGHKTLLGIRVLAHAPAGHRQQEHCAQRDGARQGDTHSKLLREVGGRAAKEVQTDPRSDADTSSARAQYAEPAIARESVGSSPRGRRRARPVRRAGPN
nr:hypothetical protein [Kribbella pittospori]